MQIVNPAPDPVKAPSPGRQPALPHTIFEQKRSLNVKHSQQRFFPGTRGAGRLYSAFTHSASLSGFAGQLRPARAGRVPERCPQLSRRRVPKGFASGRALSAPRKRASWPGLEAASPRVGTSSSSWDGARLAQGGRKGKAGDGPCSRAQDQVLLHLFFPYSCFSSMTNSQGGEEKRRWGLTPLVWVLREPRRAKRGCARTRRPPASLRPCPLRARTRRLRGTSRPAQSRARRPEGRQRLPSNPGREASGTASCLAQPEHALCVESNGFSAKPPSFSFPH